MERKSERLLIHAVSLKETGPTQGDQVSRGGVQVLAAESLSQPLANTERRPLGPHHSTRKSLAALESQL